MSEKLVLVSSSGNSAVLRSSAGYRYNVVNLPVPVLVVPAYVDYTIEFPSVEVTYADGSTRDVSDCVTCNHPNPEIPGLFELSFMLTLPGETPVKVWSSWVSIEEPPLLRGTITPWARENRTIADINRLVLEPQFQEALYASGSPLYNFMVSNAPSAISTSALNSIKGIQGYSTGDSVFLSGTMLPAGTIVESGEYTFTLKTPKLASHYVEGSTYAQYHVVEYAGTYWLALESTNSVPGEDGWLQGYSYEIAESTVPAAGNIPVDAVWVIVDTDGYLFRVEALTCNGIGHYWGHYDPNRFYDYAPGDLVSLISDNVHYIYRRNETDSSQKEIELSYRPGNYRNPHWDEVYCASSQGQLRDPVVSPITNSTNSLVAKTGSVMESVFRIYARLANIPTPLVDALGLKRGVLIWALLYRTRNTYFGFKTALQAMGLTIESLQRVHPSIKYTSEGTEIKDVYAEIGKCKEMARSIKANRLLKGNATPPSPLPSDADTIPYIRYKDDGVTVERYDADSGEWVEFYRFEKLSGDFSPAEWDFNNNNRYYRATIGFLDRIAGDNLIDLGDGEEWLSDEAFSPISLQLDTLFNYEIPIYIYLKMFVRLASVGEMAYVGSMGGVIGHDAECGEVMLRLYPTKVFDIVALETKEYWPEVSYSVTGGAYTVAEYDSTLIAPYRLYRFDTNVYLKFNFGAGKAIRRFWISPNSIGYVVGSNEPLYLCNGEVGLTADIYDVSTVSVGVSAYMWNYIFSEDGNPWALDEDTPFAGYREIPSEFICSWQGTAIGLVDYIDRITSPQGTVTYNADGDGNIVPVVIEDEIVDDEDDNIETSAGDILIALVGKELYIGGVVPKVLYLWHGEQIVGTIYLGDVPDMVSPEDTPEYSIRITFTEAQ